MFAIYKKELNSFFSSLIGYVAISVFLIAMGLFMWVFPDTNVLDYGFATLEHLFTIAPWIFLFLIPAITMRSFAEELKSGTIELLLTRPVTNMQLILGKYWAAVTLVLFSLLPTLLYYITIYYLASPTGNIDSGAVYSSYVGLLMLGAAFTAIGIFASSLTVNQIIAFIVSMFMCYLFYFGLIHISKFIVFLGKLDYIILLIGMESHYSAMSRGVIDSRDVIYFITFIIAFLFFTKVSLESRKW